LYRQAIITQHTQLLTKRIPRPPRRGGITKTGNGRVPHRAAVMRKLELDSLPDLVRFAIRNQIIQP
jgi:hypothetical protein